MNKGLNHIELKVNNFKQVQYSTENVHYEFLRMPFGLKNAPQNVAMNLIFTNIPNTLIYMDDIIIFSDNLEEHLKHSKLVFDGLQKYNRKLQIDKTDFFKK